jgi:hypothetical protein
LEPPLVAVPKKTIAAELAEKIGAKNAKIQSAKKVPKRVSTNRTLIDMLTCYVADE